jgi:hypothetical protein
MRHKARVTTEQIMILPSNLALPSGVKPGPNKTLLINARLYGANLALAIQRLISS